MQVELLNKARRSSKANDRWALDNLFWRLKIWNQTFKFGLSSPIFGKGFGVSPDYQIWNTNVDGEGKLVKRLGCDSNVIPPHNDLLTVFYKMGFLGLGLFLLINLYVLFFGFNWIYSQPNNNMKFLVLGSLGAFIFWHILAFFFNVIDSPSTAVFIWIIMGIIFATVNIGKSIVTNNRA